MEFKLITPADYKTVPWKNGRGLTKELAVHFGDDKERYLWRISIAGVTEDGHFSDFLNYDRTLMMLEGNGINLKYSDGTENMLERPYDIAKFSGDLITEGKLTDGHIKDFNVIALREKCLTDTVIISKDDQFQMDGDEICFYSKLVTSEFVIGERTFSVPEDHLLIIILDRNSKLIMKSGKLIAVTIRYIMK